jgi:hypothetical protein
MTHRPFDDHTLCLLNAAVWFVAQQKRPRHYSWGLEVIPPTMNVVHPSTPHDEKLSREIRAKGSDEL